MYIFLNVISVQFCQIIITYTSCSCDAIYYTEFNVWLKLYYTMSYYDLRLTNCRSRREYGHAGREVVADCGCGGADRRLLMVVVQVPGAVRLAVYGRGRAEDRRRRRCRQTPRGAEREVRGDRAAGQVSGTSGAHQVTAAPQQLQHVVEQVAGARTPFTQVLFGQQAQRFAVHLEQFGFESRQVEFHFSPLYERGHVLFGPDSRVGNCAKKSNNQILVL